MNRFTQTPHATRAHTNASAGGYGWRPRLEAVAAAVAGGAGGGAWRRRRRAVAPGDGGDWRRWCVCVRVCASACACVCEMSRWLLGLRWGEEDRLDVQPALRRCREQRFRQRAQRAISIHPEHFTHAWNATHDHSCPQCEQARARNQARTGHCSANSLSAGAGSARTVRPSGCGGRTPARPRSTSPLDPSPAAKAAVVASVQEKPRLEATARLP